MRKGSWQLFCRAAFDIIIENMLDKTLQAINLQCPFDFQKVIVVGVSGGPDSLCLLDILHTQGFRLLVAHLDHQLRPESQAEAQHVEAVALQMGLPCAIHRADIASWATQNGLSIEEAARERRYRFLFEQAALHQAQAVAVGHTADDQVETVFMHLLRGAGLSGLRGMNFYSLPNPWSQQIALARPLLSAWRSEIESYLAQRGLEALLDQSNFDLRFYRNRLRHETLPYLEGLNPGFRARLWQMSNLLGDEEDLLEALTQAAWQEVCLEQGAGFVAFDIQSLQRQPLALQRRLVRRGMAALRPGLRDIDFAAVERALNFVRAPTRSQVQDLAAGLRLELDGERLWVAAWTADLPGAQWPQVTAQREYLLNAPGELELPGGWRLRAKLIPASTANFDEIRLNQDPWLAWVDAESLSWPVTVRGRLPGERFQPLGMGEHSLKLSDFFINQGVPRRARPNWPLMISQETVVWVAGLRLAQPFAVHPDSQQLIVFSLGRDK
jgi:tRNA(Ile)-lysidine synthase